jgi:hypothetical protein
MDHRDLEKVSYKAQSMLCAALAEDFHPSGRRATVIFHCMADPPTSWANQSIRASIVGLSTKSEDIARPTVARTYLLGEFEKHEASVFSVAGKSRTVVHKHGEI